MAKITEQDVMKNFTKCLSGSVLTGIAKIDEAVKQGTKKFNSLQDVVDNMVADCRNAGSAEVFLRDYCGITNQNVPKENFPLTYIDPETGATIESIPSSSWGVYLYPKEDGTSTTYQDLLPQNGEIKVANKTTFNRHGLNVNMPNFESLTNEDKLALNGVYSWWIEYAVKLVEDTFNVDFDGQSIDIAFDNEKNRGGATTYSSTKNGKILDRPELDIHRSSANYTDLAEYAIPKYGADNIASKAVKVYGPYGITSILAHEITHVAQFYFNLPSSDRQINKTPAYLDEGMADLTVGRFYSNDITELAGNADLLAKYLNIENPSTEGSKHYEAGFMFWHYLMKQTADSSDKATDYSKPEFVGTDGADTGHVGYVKFGNGSNYSLGGGDDKLNIHGDNISVDGGGGNDSIDNSGANVTITGGTGNDTINMGEQWNNVFTYKVGDGNDIIYGFNEHDELKISGASHSIISSDNDVIVSVGDGQVWLQNANGKNLKIINDALESVTPDSGTIIKKSNNVYTYGTGNRTITSYAQNEIVRLDDYQGLDDISGNNFYIKSSSGRLTIQNSHGKWIGYSAFNSEVIAYSYVASSSGNVDGRLKDQAKILIGAHNKNNSIVAGDGDASLWGGNGGTDTLTGGDGRNEFYYTIGNENDVIKDAEYKDLVNLLGVSLNQITGYSSDSNSTTLQFSDGGSLRVEGSSTIDYLIGGQKYWYNRYLGKMVKS